MSGNRHPDRSTEIAKFLHETTDWGGPARVNIVLRWPGVTPEQIERGILIARECWACDEAERAHRAGVRS